jgi:tetratricopeptide (TPR) repeat protein
MNDHDKQGNADFSTIQPAAIDLTRRAPETSGTANAPASVKQQRWLWPTFSLLLLIATSVVFILPKLIEPTTLTSPPNNQAVSGTDQIVNQTAPQSAQAASSPWAEAQEARQRQQSQELLSQLLKLQKELEDKQVRVWAESDFNLMLGHAADGDTAYRERNFELSANLYSKTVDGMKLLLAKMDPLFEENIVKGNEALASGNADKAGQFFELALLMKPEDARAQTGMQRSRTLDSVLQLITDGNNLQQNNELEPAREKYQQALSLDKYAETASQQLKTVNAKILDRDFNRLMSEGLAQLQANNLERAKSSFQRALKLKPNAGEALSALSQTETAITNAQINLHLQNAVSLEKQEKWNEALAEYNNALGLDANLAQAQEGKHYASNRATLDSRLEQIIAEPARLANKAVYEETRLLYQQLATMVAPDPRLARQLNELSTLLERAAIPVQVTFISDNLTEVVIYRVGTLGKFEQHSLTLFPGNYVAMGTRQGYRDVRVEFTVNADSPAQSVQISAVERIASR